MHIGAQFFQALFMLDAEMLFFINDQQTKITELDLSGEQSMGADNNIDAAFGQLLFGLFQFLSSDKPRGMGDLQRQTFEAFDEILVVLAGQQGCGYNHGHLFSGIGRHKGGPQCHFGFAKANVTAN